jgi:hypothetical protein
MVERKKTNRAKARKGVSPINHFDLNAFSFPMLNSTPGSNVEKSGDSGDLCWISFLTVLHVYPSVHVEFKNQIKIKYELRRKLNSRTSHFYECK